MKTRILIFCLAAIMSLMGCQDEEREIIDPTIDDTIPRDSQLANLIKNVVTHDGSFDNIVDKGHCFSIKLPYMVLRNQEEFLIDDLNDYQLLTDTDNIQIQFPVVVTLFNYQEVDIENQTQLDALSNACVANDPDIECIDFTYPIRISTFDSRTNRLETLDLFHDSEMFEFMDQADETVSMSINYPIDLLLHNGQSSQAQHNTALLNAILEVATACDENDL